MTDVVLGTMPPPGSKRDATHVATVVLEAATMLYPAQRVVLTPDGKIALAMDGDTILGIVDPFLTLPVAPGASPYVCLMPRSVTGLRHEYEHPILDGKTSGSAGIVVARADSMDPVEASKRWIDAWCQREFIRPSEMMVRAQDWIDNQDYWVEGGRFEGMGVPDEFWDHFARVTNQEVPKAKRGSFFSCSC